MSQSAEPLAQRAYAEIKKRVVRCELPPGCSVSEAGLSADLALGKTPIREALARLRRDGLVVAIPRSGYRITEITIRDVTEMFALRILLEAEAARLAAERAGDDGGFVALLDRLCDVPFDPLDSERLSDFLGANTTFHAEVAKQSGNRRLAMVLDDLVVQSERLFWLGVPTSPHVGEMVGQHRAIVDAIRRADVDAAGEVAAEHVRTSRKVVIDALLESDAAVAIAKPKEDTR